MKPLIIGIGNTDRGDDGIGIQVARTLKGNFSDAADVVTSNGDPTSLMELWRGRDTVEIIDAVTVRGRPVGEWFLLDAAKNTVPTGLFHTSTHAFGLAEAVELGRLFDNLPSSLRLWLVCASNFEPLSEIQPAVFAAGEIVQAEIINACHLQSNPVDRSASACTNTL